LIERYLRGHSVAEHKRTDILILDLMAENEGGDRDADDGAGLLSSLIPLHADIAAGDHARYTWRGCHPCKVVN